MNRLFKQERRAFFEWKKFKGLHRDEGLCNGDAAYELRNLRVLPDGSLKRREGFAPLLTLDASIRGMFSTVRNGSMECYAVAGDKIYTIFPENEEWQSCTIGSLQSGIGEVEFFCQYGKVLLLDRTDGKIYVLTPQTAVPMQAYIPLYAKGWRTDGTGERSVMEQPNLLTRKIEIRYIASEQTADFSLGVIPASVDKVTVNEETVLTLSLSSDGVLHLYDTLHTGDVVDVFMTMPDSFYPLWQEAPVSCHMQSIGSADEPRILFYDDENAGKVWFSRPVGKARRTVCEEFSDASCSIYVTGADRCEIGDGVRQVTGVCRQYDQALLFTDTGCYTTDGSTEDGSLKIASVNAMLGCSRQGGVAALGNRVVSLQGQNVLLWNSQANGQNEGNAVEISREARALFPQNFGRTYRAFANTAQEEFWFYCPGTAKPVFVYSPAQEAWGIFDGFSPAGMMPFMDTVAFWQENIVYCFDESLSADFDADGEKHGISAVFRSQLINMGSVGQCHRGCDGELVAACAGMQLHVAMEALDGKCAEAVLYGGDTAPQEFFFRGIRGRFSFLRFSLSCEDEGDFRLFFLKLSAVSV